MRREGISLVLKDIVYEIEGEVVIRRSSLNLQGPGLVQIIGPNGAGKTTLLRIIAGIISPLKGSVVINGEEVAGSPSKAGKFIGYVPQRPPISRFNPMTVWEFVESRILLTRRWPRITAPRREHVERVLEIVGLPREAWHKRLQDLSGGQLMRSYIARTLVHNPPILLLDEPLSPVDPVGRSSLAKLLVSLSNTRLVIITSHDPMILLDNTKILVLMNRGIVAYGPPREVLQMDILSSVYGEAVIEVRRHYHISDYHAG